MNTPPRDPLEAEPEMLRVFRNEWTHPVGVHGMREIVAYVDKLLAAHDRMGAELVQLRADGARWRDLCQSADDHGWLFDGGCSITIGMDSIESGVRITQAMTDTMVAI